MTMRRIGWIFVLILASVAGSAASEASFSGTWKLNLEKSQLSGQTLTIEKNPSGTFHYDVEGFAFDFDLTGKEYPTPDGGTTAWKALDATTWDSTSRMHGKVVGTYRASLKGDTMVSVMKVTKPDGSVVEQTLTLARVSGGPGFLGKWKSGDVTGAPTSIVILTNTPDHITLKYPEFKQVCEASFDGKDYVIKTAGVPTKMTQAFEKTGVNSFRMATKLDGKPFYTDVFTLSPDGKVLTDEGNSVSVNEPVKAVFDRQ
jgi:hypothetical protein